MRTSTFDDDEQVVRSSTTVTRTRVVRVARQSFSLCVSTTVEVAGQEFSSEPLEITKKLAPHVESSNVLGNATVTVDGREYSTQVVQMITTSGTRRDTSSLYFCDTTTPRMLKRITISTDSLTPEITASTTVRMTELNKKKDVLGETKCTWSVTTVVKKGDRTTTIRETHCEDVPGELVSQWTEERNAEGKLISRRELELTGYGYGRFPRRFRRSR